MPDIKINNLELENKLTQLGYELNNLKKLCKNNMDLPAETAYIEMMEKWDELVIHIEEKEQLNVERANQKTNPAVLHAREYNGLLKLIQIMHSQLVYREDKFDAFDCRELKSAYGDLLNSFHNISEKLEQNLVD